jgi:hypothetical protein
MTASVCCTRPREPRPDTESTRNETAAGLDDAAMDTWHAEFEKRAPQAHHAFLHSLGIPEEEIRKIRHEADVRHASLSDPA